MSQPTAEPTYEAQLARLVALVERLETGELPLAEALAVYEEGVTLAAQCQQLLGEAELRVQRLTVGMDGPTLDPWSSDS